jgi:rubredoxin
MGRIWSVVVCGYRYFEPRGDERKGEERMNVRF